MTGRQRILALAVAAVVVVITLWRVLAGGSGGEEEFATDVAVHVDTVARGTVHRFVAAYGTVEPEPALDGRPAAGALIAPFVDGVVASVEAVEGRRVAAGTVLFRLDGRVAGIAVERAQAGADVAEQAFKRQEQLLATDGTSQRAYLEARQRMDAARADLATARTELSYTEITAPLDGVVTRIAARPGQRVDMGTVLAQVVDLSRLVVAADVPAAEIGGVAVGRPVLLGSGDDAPRGAVLAVGRDVDPATGTYRVLVSVPATAGFMPGQFAEVSIQAEERPDVLVVPEESLVTRAGEGSWVMAVRDGQATRAPVTAGLRDGGLVEIAGEGVEPGTVVVTVEAYSLPEATRVRVVGG
ncbi:MAG TPA: efflux RND transporter periplasmic adaptor subunit [Longimicrobiales bacterium]|nr:efflux RND transporter periplasmic adaptor subunit [Longimicrobiales bacterium]